jgi:hypothetical protein
LNCLKPTPFLSHSALFTLINKDGEQIQEYLYNPTGKIVSSYWHRSNMDVNKSYSKNLFLKLRTIIIGIKLRSSVVLLVFFNYNSFNSCFSDKLGNLTVALGVAGAGIALHFKK